jgi:hypothetical protein
MDFKSILNKLDSIEAPVATPAAPVLEKAVQLNEDAELRVLAGTSSYISEAKKAKEEKKKDENVDEGFDDNAKVGDKMKTQHGTLTKTATGVKHERSYTKEKDEDDEDSKPKAKKAKKESIDTEAFKGKFAKMVEAKKEEKDAKKKPMKEAAKPDFLDVDKDGDKKEPMKKAAADKKKGSAPKKGVNPFAKKKTVKESIEPKLTFKDMVRLVQESGGQQQIDPVDTALFTWAQRVAANKFTESTKAELFAGMLYERNGGKFEMYDVLSESVSYTEGFDEPYEGEAETLWIGDDGEEVEGVVYYTATMDPESGKISVKLTGGDVTGYNPNAKVDDYTIQYLINDPDYSRDYMQDAMADAKEKFANRDQDTGESAEQLAELSPRTLQNYAGKAKSQGNWAAGVAAHGSTPDREKAKYEKLAAKRKAGAAQAEKKAGGDKVDPVKRDPKGYY